MVLVQDFYDFLHCHSDIVVLRIVGNNVIMIIYLINQINACVIGNK